VSTSSVRSTSSRFGSAADYLRANGMGDDELVELRRVLVAER